MRLQALYSSADLATWELVNPSLIPGDRRPNGVYFRPKLIHNVLTSRWVLWYFNTLDLLNPFTHPFTHHPIPIHREHPT